MNTWLFLRGLTRESRHWGSFIEKFQLAQPGSCVVSLDLPGNGKLNQLRSPLSVQAMVAHCRAELARRHIAPPYQVLAMSLGAMVAVAWAQDYPQEIAANVLINTSMRPFNPIYQRLRPANYGVLLKMALFGATPEEWERTTLLITSNHPGDDVVPLWVELRRECPVSPVNALRQLLAAALFRASPVQPLVPTLVLASLQDHLVSVECSLALARIWRCALSLHASAGHDLPLDDGHWVIAKIHDWQMGSLK
jgi:alpha-beta hydrolase superfamily lysophospholipase